MSIPRNGDFQTYLKVFEECGLSVVIVNSDGSLLFLNSHAAQHLGYEPTELIGKSVLDFSPKVQPNGQASDQLMSQYIEQVSKAPVEIEWLHLTKSGNPLWVGVKLTRYPQDKDLIIALWSDIKSKKQYEEKMLEAEQRLNNFLSHIPAITYIKNENLEHIYSNNPLDVSEAQNILGKKSSDIFPADIALSMERDDIQALELGKPVITDRKISQKYKEELWVKDIKFRYETLSGEPLIGGIALDISDTVIAQSKAEKALRSLVQALHKAMDARDPYTAGHANRVADIALKIARKMGLQDEQLICIELGAQLHDIGKISVPVDILNKPGKLSKAQFEIIKEHPTTGYDVIKDVEFPWPIADVVYQHHERLDGSGYPRGLKDEEITIEAKIIAVADTLEAITSHRPYRPKLPSEVAIDVLKQGAGTKYDRMAVESCLELIADGQI